MRRIIILIFLAISPIWGEEVPVKLINTVFPITINANGKDTTTIKVLVKNSTNTTVSDSSSTITFNLKGPGSLIGLNPVNANYNTREKLDHF